MIRGIDIYGIIMELIERVFNISLITIKLMDCVHSFNMESYINLNSPSAV